jgi:hypothetical protein
VSNAQFKLNAEGQSLWEEKFARGMVRNFAPPDFPVIVCLCGSTKFIDAFQKANYEETMGGRIVLSVGFAGRLQRQRVVIDGCMGPQEAEVLVARSGEAVGCTPEQKAGLDELHKRKIDLADEVLVLNVTGYVGASTRGEVLHAYARGKKVRWLEPDKIPADLFRPDLAEKE